MTIPTEVAASCPDCHSQNLGCYNSAAQLMVCNDCAQTIDTELSRRRKESALTKAEAVEPVATVCFRGDRYASGNMIEVQLQIVPGTELPIGTKLYAHAPPAVLSGRIPFAGYDPKFCPGSNPESPQSEDDVAVPVESFGRDADGSAQLNEFAALLGKSLSFKDGSPSERLATAKTMKFVMKNRAELLSSLRGPACNCPGEGKSDRMLHAPNCPIRATPPPASVPDGDDSDDDREPCTVCLDRGCNGECCNDL